MDPFVPLCRSTVHQRLVIPSPATPQRIDNWREQAPVGKAGPPYARARSGADGDGRGRERAGGIHLCDGRERRFDGRRGRRGRVDGYMRILIRICKGYCGHFYHYHISGSYLPDAWHRPGLPQERIVMPPPPLRRSLRLVPGLLSGLDTRRVRLRPLRLSRQSLHQPAAGLERS